MSKEIIDEVKDSTENLQEKADRMQKKNERTLAYFNDMDNPEYDDIEKDILKTGISIPEFKKQWAQSVNAMSGLDAEPIEGYLPTAENYSNVYDFKNSTWDDFATHFQDGLTRIAYGGGVIVPGLVASTQASGESPEWVNDWIEGVGDWFEETKERVSPESQESFFETGSLKSFAGGMGSGLASMAPMLLNFVPVVGKGAYVATTFADVFGSVLKNAQEHGLSQEDAARMALFTSIPVTALGKDWC